MLGAQEKTPAEAGAGKACLLSHIKAPAQGGKAGGGKPPGTNLALGLGSYKRLFQSARSANDRGPPHTAGARTGAQRHREGFIIR